MRRQNALLQTARSEVRTESSSRFTTVYVKNKNELESLTKVNILDRVQENNKLIDLTVSQNEDNVKRQSRDADYLYAVEHGDMETAQRMVDEAAELAFADSKIRDEDGKL